MTDDQLLLAERYRLGDRLGWGGMAEVRRGFDLRLERWVAVKRLKVELAADPAFQERFRREAHAVAHLNHPGIAAIYDTGEQVDARSQVPVPFLVMELVDGPTLRDVLRDDGALPPARALDLIAVILRALAHSHGAGIIHRDIKPSNIMLTPRGDAKVMDFGIARAAAETTTGLTGTATVIGTAHYLSPEQARGERVDLRSDVYSTGCLLYELLLGRPPFIGDSPVSVAFQHVRETPVPPSQLNPGLGPEIDRLISRSLAKDPDDRYASADEMADDVERVRAGLDPAETSAEDGRPAESSVAADDPEATRHLPGRSARAATVLSPGVGPVATDPGPMAVAIPPERPAAEDPLTESMRPPGGRSLIIALVTLLLLGGLAFAGYRILTPAPARSVSVPGLVGSDRATVEQALLDVELQAAFRHVRGPDDATRNTVVRQSPGAGTEVPPQSTVTAEINVGPPTARIPKDLVGRPLADVLEALEDADFVNVIAVPVTDVPKGFKPDQVVTVTPGEGQKAAPEEDIVVSYVGRASRPPTTAGAPPQPGGRAASGAPSPVATVPSPSAAAPSAAKPSPSDRPSRRPSSPAPSAGPTSAAPEPSEPPSPEPSEPEPSPSPPLEPPPSPSAEPSVEPSGPEPSGEASLPGAPQADDPPGPADTSQEPPGLGGEPPSGGPG